MSHEKSIDELRWVRIFTPIHIPKYLVEQVRNRDYTVEDFYKYHEINCVNQTEKGPTLNPFSHLYILVDPENQVKGFLWFCVDPLTKDLIIQTYSIDKDYWFKGRAVAKLSKHIKEIRKKANLNKIYWITNYPKHSEKYGFKRSKGVLMEYSEEKHGENTYGRNNPRRERRAHAPRAIELPDTSIGFNSTASGTELCSISQSK